MNKLKIARAFPILALLFCAVFVAPSQATAQLQQYHNYDRYRYLPKLPQEGKEPVPLPESPREATGDPTILIDNLKGIVFVDHPDKVMSTADVADVEGIQFGTTTQLNLLRSAAYQQIARSYLHKPVSILSLNELVRDTILFYRRCDQPVVDVSVPEQDITDGVVQVVVTEARIGQVRVEGGCYFNPDMLKDQLFLCPGSRICESQLMEELEWLYRNPFRTVDLELTPGAAHGQTDVVFKVHDKLPWRFYGGYEDTGTRQTGLERVFAGFNWYNVFGEDDYMGYQYTANPQFERFQAHSMYYSTALYNRDIVSIYGSLADYNASVPLLGTTEGSSWQVLGRWYRELEDIGDYKHGITAGFDFKQANSALDFAVFIPGTTFDIAQLMASYSGGMDDDLGAWSLGTDIYWSPGGFSGHNSTTSFQGVNPYATADYFYTRGFFERRLDAAMETELVARITGQLSEGNLMPTEQLGFGGYNSIRGYDQYSALGDSGYFINLEWWTPVIPVRTFGHCGADCASLRGLVFYDVGQAFIHKPLPGQDPITDLNSIGCGFRYNIDPRVQLRFDYGYQLNDVLFTGSTSQRVHLGLVMSY